MSKLPILSGQEIIKVLKKIGYRPIRQRGSHIRLDCAMSGRKRITIPDYRSVDTDLLSKILKSAGITKEEFSVLMKK